MAEAVQVAFLGPKGTFTHETALQWLRSRDRTDAALAPYPSLAATIDAVRSGAARYGVVAVETSLNGPIAESSEELERGGVGVIDQIKRICHYHLLAVSGASLLSIAEVRSHQKALDDCARQLAALAPRARLTPTASTAAAAASVASEGRANVAAVGTATAGEHHGLTPLAENIEDDPRNWTRWVVIEK